MSEHWYSKINRKINTLNAKALHYKNCRDDALEKIAILEKALFILDPNKDNYLLDGKTVIKMENPTFRECIFLQGSPRPLVKRVLRENQGKWLSTRDIVIKICEIERLEFDEWIYNPIRNHVSSILRRLHELGVIERKDGECTGYAYQYYIKWRLP